MNTLIFFLMLIFNTHHYQTGFASHLGCGWNGKMGASGLTYDCSMPLAAHKSLPFGVIIEVRNPKNGRSVKQMIFDRGPYAKGRVLDLQKKAAHYLCGKPCGGLKVEYRVISTKYACKEYKCLRKRFGKTLDEKEKKEIEE